MARFCPVGTKPISLMFSKEFFDRNEGKNWAKERDFKYGTVDNKRNFWHFPQADYRKFNKIRTIEIDAGIKLLIGCPKMAARKRKRKRKKNSTVALESPLAMNTFADEGDNLFDIPEEDDMKVFGNPIHIPSTGRGPKATPKWWIVDLYGVNKKKFKTIIGKGSKKSAEYDAAGFVGHGMSSGKGRRRIVKSAILSGPYNRKPTTRTKRK